MGEWYRLASRSAGARKGHAGCLSDGAEDARTGRVNGSKRSPRTHQTAHLARASHAPRHVLEDFKHCATTHAPLALIAHRADR